MRPPMDGVAGLEPLSERLSTSSIFPSEIMFATLTIIAKIYMLVSRFALSR